jgi:AraC-like DNA-binding protein
MSRDIHRQLGAAISKPPRREEKPKALSIGAWVRENIDRINCINDVANAFAMSPETLRRTFSRQEHEALGHFIKTEKISKMKELLRNTEKKCFEIALCDLGFRREDVAARFFKRATGVTMLEYRAKSQAYTQARNGANHSVEKEQAHAKRDIFIRTDNKSRSSRSG